MVEQHCIFCGYEQNHYILHFITEVLILYNVLGATFLKLGLYHNLHLLKTNTLYKKTNL